MSTVNKSKTYLLPLVDYELGLDFNIMNFISNTYAYPHVDNMYVGEGSLAIQISKRFGKYSKFKMYHDKLLDNDLFLYWKFTGDVYHYIVNVPDYFLSAYRAFIDGKYSLMSEAAKDRINYHLKKYYTHRKDITETVCKILKKDLSLKVELERQLGTILPKDSELADKINIDDETIFI